MLLLWSGHVRSLLILCVLNLRLLILHRGRRRSVLHLELLVVELSSGQCLLQGLEGAMHSLLHSLHYSGMMLHNLSMELVGHLRMLLMYIRSDQHLLHWGRLLQEVRLG